MNKHSTFYIEKIKKIEVCNFTVHQIEGGKLEWPYEAEPTQGVHDYQNCEKCLYTHKFIYENVKNKFDKFPLCCEFHRKMGKTNWFDKTKFGNLPKMVADKAIYTNQHILNHIENDNWYKEIYFYIEYVTESFGSIPYQYGNPLYLDYYYKFVVELVKSINSIPKDKKQKLVSLIYLFSKPKKQTDKDYFKLFQTYNKWIRAFPFELPFFSDLQNEYKNKLPIFLHDDIEINPYTKIAKAHIYSEQELITNLIAKTKDLLSSVKYNLKHTPSIPDATKTTLLLIGEQSRIEQESLLEEFNKHERKYISILRRWLQLQRKYFDSIKPYLKEEPVSLEPTKRELLKKALIEKGFYEIEKVKELPSENIELLLNLISDHKVPYQIAMLDYIGFNKHILKNHFFNNQKRQITWFTKVLNNGKNDRLIKGCLNVLSVKSGEKKKEFSSHLEKENIIKDYQLLKRGK